MPPNQNHSHEQVPCKVTTYVDKGIKRLVEILNTFDKLWTCDSCEGSKKEQASVFLGYGTELTSSQETCEFICKIISSFNKHINSIDCAGYKTHISIEWWGEKQHPLILVKMPHNCIEEVANIFACVRKELEDDNVDK